MDDPLQTSKIETGEIETMASRVAAMNNAASNPQVDGGGVPQGDQYESPEMYDPGAAGGGGEPLPFAVALGDGDNLSVAGGAYQVGATGSWITISATPAAAGTHVYLVVEQDADREVTSVSVSVETAALANAVVIDTDTDYATSNVLLAEIVADELVQRRHGNFTLGLWQIDGDVVRWPETLAGSIPTPAV